MRRRPVRLAARDEAPAMRASRALPPRCETAAAARAPPPAHRLWGQHWRATYFSTRRAPHTAHAAPRSASTLEFKIVYLQNEKPPKFSTRVTTRRHPFSAQFLVAGHSPQRDAASPPPPRRWRQCWVPRLAMQRRLRAFPFRSSALWVPFFFRATQKRAVPARAVPCGRVIKKPRGAFKHLSIHAHTLLRLRLNRRLSVCSSVVDEAW